MIRPKISRKVHYLDHPWTMVPMKLIHFRYFTSDYFGTEFQKERSLTELNWELVIFLRVTLSRKIDCIFSLFLIETRAAKNKHPTDKRLDTRVSQCDTQMSIK